MKKIGNREGGAGQSAGHSSGSVSSNQELFEAIRNEFDAIKDIGLAVENDATDLASALLLVNELKVKWNSLINLTKEFEK